MISLGTPWSAAENFACTWEHLGVLATGLWVPTTSLGVPTTSLGALTRSLGALGTSLGAPRITVQQCGKHNIFFGEAAGAHGNHSYYLSFNNF